MGYRSAVGVVLLVATLTACSGEDTAQTFQNAADCYNRAMQVSEDGGSLIVHAKGPNAVMSVDCLSLRLGLSDAVHESILDTTALMGRQDADDGDYHYSWSYHPSNGLDLIVTKP